MKTIVTHMGPDIDAITSVWLIRKYHPELHDARLQFVPTGTTLNSMQPDEDPDIIHVDTGMGKFDHHQFKAKLSASLIIFKFLKENDYIFKYDTEALERLVNQVNDFDNFQEVYFPDAAADIYDFSIHQFVEGLKPTLPDNEQLVILGSTVLEGILQVLKNKVRAEKEIEKGVILKTSMGKAIVMETKNEEAMKLAQKMGYILVARKDPNTGNVRIKCAPDDKLDLTPIHEAIKKIDKTGTWFMHVSKHMLLNGSSKNPKGFVPSSLTTKQLVEIIEKV